jgi:hypothetical protein
MQEPGKCRPSRLTPVDAYARIGTYVLDVRVLQRVRTIREFDSNL